MDSELPVIVVEASETDESAMCALIIAGLTERWGTYDPEANPDLQELGVFYGHSKLLVAKVEGRLVGCGILVIERDGVGRIVRMSVAVEFRRLGIGRLLLEKLIEAGTSLGCSKYVLETTATWRSAVSFYSSQGFIRTVEENGNQYFMRAFAQQESTSQSA